MAAKWKPGDIADYTDGVGIAWQVTIKQVSGDEIKAETTDGRQVRDLAKHFKRIKKGGKDGKSGKN